MFDPESYVSDGRLEERLEMVNTQLIPRGIRNKAVLESMLTVPRHHFVPANLQSYAYYDGPLAIGEGQTISQPYIVALMAEALDPSHAGKILEIGTGSGYAAAVLSRLAGKVFTIERHAVLAHEAQARLKSLKYDNVQVRTGDGTRGWPGEAPFEGILVSAGAPGVPQTLCSQLSPGGRMVVPVGDRNHQELVLVERNPAGGFTRKSLGAVKFVPLIGAEGWQG